MNLSDPVKKNKSQFGKEKLPEPEIELTGFNQPSAFGQLISSGLNVVSTLSGRKKNNAPPAMPAPDSAKSTYKPTWNEGNFEPHIEHTNFTSAIGEYKKQQENPKLRKGAPHQVFFRRERPPMPLIYKLAIFAVCSVLALGTFMYVDKKYNLRKTIQELKDPSKVKLKVKRKPEVIDE